MIEPLRPSPDLDRLPVYDADEVPIGRTFGVLTEAETGLVRYFDISLDERGRHVLVPVGHTRLERHLGGQRLRLRAAVAEDLDAIPAYEPHIPWSDDEFHNTLLNAYGRLFQGERYYAHPAFDHGGLYAGQHPILREPLAPAAPSGLHRLSKLEHYRIADGEPDIHGWRVCGHGGDLGVISDVIIDPDAEQVRYVVVVRESDQVEMAVPVGYARVLDAALGLPFTTADLDALSAAPAAELSRTDEAEIRIVLDQALSGRRAFARPDFRSAA